MEGNCFMPVKSRNIHVLPDGDRWAVIREGSKGPIAYHQNRQDAANHARNIAKRDRVEMLVFDNENQIRDHENYRELPVSNSDRSHDGWTG